MDNLRFTTHQDSRVHVLMAEQKNPDWIRLVLKLQQRDNIKLRNMRSAFEKVNVGYSQAIAKRIAKP